MMNLFKKYQSLPYVQKTSINNKISMACNFAWAVIKFILANVIGSYFLTLSGFYTICIALAKCSYFDGRRNAKTQFKEEKYYKQIAVMLIIAGLIYLLYIFEIFLATHEQSYGLIPAITIALVAFCEIIFSVRGLIMSWKSKDLLLIGLKLINVSSALSSLVLTQIAILSVHASIEENILFNTLFGMIVGVITIIFGSGMFFYLSYFNKTKFNLLKSKKIYLKNKIKLKTNSFKIQKNI